MMSRAMAFLGCCSLLGLAGCSNAPADPKDKPLSERVATSGAAATTDETTPTADPKPMLAVQTEPYGTTAAGADITEYLLTNSQGTRIQILNYGGIVAGVYTPDRTGQSANITCSFPDLPGYEANGPYFGGLVGRFANRIAGGKFSLAGTEYTLFVNNGPNHLHGGKESFIKKVWDHETVETSDAVGVKLTYVSADGEEGYPGTLTTTVVYSLNERNELTIDYTATTDKTTVVNLTNHCYWNLGGVGSGPIVNHQLTLPSDAYLPVDEGGIPTGELATVEGTPMDFRQPHLIGERMAQTVNGGGGYDHCYVVNGAAGELRPAATVYDEKSGRVMEILTTEPGIQFYTGNFLDGTEAVAGNALNTAFCLETQHFPDSPNRPEFPTTTLEPGATYRHTTVHRFSVK